METEYCHHLVVCCHGFGGFSAWMKYLAKELSDASKEVPGGVRVHVSTCNDGFLQTSDGILLGGSRLADEIEAIADRMPRLNKFSIIGHSVGGLYARYAIGLLRLRGFLGKKVKGCNYVSLATPHFGVRRAGDLQEKNTATSWYRKIFHGVVGVLGRTGMHLMLHDTDGSGAPLGGTPVQREDNPKASSSDPEVGAEDVIEEEEVEDTRTGGHAADEVPMLLVISRKDSIYFRALKDFSHRTAYGNVVGDFQVPFSTGVLVSSNPFKHRYTELVPLHASKPHIVGEMSPESHEWILGGDRSTQLSQKEPEVPFVHEDSVFADSMRDTYLNLTSLTWRRVAVLFKTLKDYPHPAAHQHIVVAIEALNGGGKDVVADVVENFQF